MTNRARSNRVIFRRLSISNAWSGIFIVATVVTGVAVPKAAADTLETALAQAYQNNPQLNAQRAATRAADEGVPIALGGYRPRVTATASLSEQHLEITSRTLTRNTLAVGNQPVTTYGLTATQTLYDGFQARNRTRQAESQVVVARETLRIAEQTVLLNAVTAYVNVLRDGSILELQRSNVNVLDTILRQTRDRFKFRDVTETDVAQAESRLAGGRASMLGAESNYVSSRATYRQVIGVEAGKLAVPKSVDRLSPPTLSGMHEQARAEHPAITTAVYNVDSAVFQVKIAQGALHPTLTLQGGATRTIGSTTSLTTPLTTPEFMSAAVVGQLSVPIYQGGGEYATIRQAKETLGQRQLDLDAARQQVDLAVTQSWAQLKAAKAQIQAILAQVTAVETALRGVREEARVGQRTTLDVLNAQQDLVNARVALATAQRDRALASYSVLAATGRLSPQILGLRIATYDPTEHYQQVRDSWFGVRTPDGR